MQGRGLLRGLLGALLLWTAPIQAQKAEEPPPVELLEFLADWETENGAWMDPTRMDEIPIPEKKDDENDDPDTP